MRVYEGPLDEEQEESAAAAPSGLLRIQSFDEQYPYKNLTGRTKRETAVKLRSAEASSDY